MRPARLWNADGAPAMNRGDGGLDQLGDGGRAAERVDDGTGFGVGARTAQRRTAFWPTCGESRNQCVNFAVEGEPFAGAAQMIEAPVKIALTLPSSRNDAFKQKVGGTGAAQRRKATKGRCAIADLAKADRAVSDDIDAHAASATISFSASCSRCTRSNVAPLRLRFQRDGVVGSMPARSQMRAMGTRWLFARANRASMGSAVSMDRHSIGRAA